MRALRRNLAYKILSLGLGIALYAVAFLQNNPRTSQEILIQPETEKLPANMTVKKKADAISVTVTGNAAAIQAFKQQTVKASLDLSRAEAGSNRVTIRYKHDMGLIDLNGPSFAEVTLEKITRKAFTIELQYNNAPPPGFAFKEAAVRPRQAQVKGAESEIKKVESVGALVDNNGPFAGLVELVAFNKNREAMDSVDVDPKQALVTLEVKTAPASKSLLLSPVWTGTAAPGFTITNYAFDPLAVTVSGTAAQLMSVSRLPVPTNIAGIRESVTRNLTVPTPSNLRIVDPADGKVSLRLEVSSIALPAPATATPTTGTSTAGTSTAGTPTPTNNRNALAPKENP